MRARRGEAENPFPKAAQMEALAASPRPQRLFRSDRIAVDRWALKGPFPETVGIKLRQPSNRWEQLLAEVANERPGTVQQTDDMACLARELGAFQLVHKRGPTDP